MRHYLTGLWLALSGSLLAATVQVSTEWGYDATDATAFLQAALDAGHPHDVVIIDGAPGTVWYTDPLFVHRDNFTLIIQPGVSVVARSGQFNGLDDCLLSLTDRTNVRIEGTGASLVMQKAEYQALNDAGERHAIRIQDGSQLTIRGLRIADSGGDGVHLTTNGHLGPDLVFLQNLALENHLNNGIRAERGFDIQIEHCHIGGTSGGFPAAGIHIDVIPGGSTNLAAQAAISHCTIANNDGNGIRVDARQATGSGDVVVGANDLYLKNNGLSTTTNFAAFAVYTADTSPPTLVDLWNTLIEDHGGWALRFETAADKTTIAVDNVVMRDCTTDPGMTNNAPVAIVQPGLGGSNPSTAPYGGISFVDALVEDALNRPHVRTSGGSNTKDITGRIFVVNPNVGTSGSAVNQSINGFGTNNVTLTQTPMAAWPNSSFFYSATDDTATEGSTDLGTYTADRSASSDIRFPLPVYLAASGSATDRLDLHHLPTVLVLPAGATTASQQLRAVSDGLAEPSETYTLTVQANSAYTVPLFNTGTVTIADPPALPLDWESVVLRVADCRATLTWHTRNERGVAHFEVERRAPTGWTAIGRQAATNEAIQRYDFSVSGVTEGDYLRIRQVDWDGQYTFSSVVRVGPLCPVDLPVLTPNPVADLLTIESPETPDRIEVLDAHGRTRLRRTYTRQLDLRPLPAGTYLVRLTRGHRVHTRRVIRR